MFPTQTTQSNNTNDPNTQTPTSYANITEKSSFPTKEDAIVIDSIDNAQIKEYTLAVGNLIGPKNIKFVSRISKNRICMYLTDKKTVNKLTDTNTTIKIKDQELEIRHSNELFSQTYAL